MSILDDAMRKHIENIVCTEKRPFSYIDFLTFEVDQEHYKMSHGTFRNKISAMLKAGEIELAYYSKQAFYTLNGVKFTKQMTPYHTGGIGYTVIIIINNLFTSRITNDAIAADNGIGTGTVSNIIDEWKKGVQDSDYESIRELSVFCKKQGVTLNALVSCIRLGANARVYSRVIDCQSRQLS